MNFHSLQFAARLLSVTAVIRKRNRGVGLARRRGTKLLTALVLRQGCAMSACLAVVPWPPAIVAPVTPYFLSASPTAMVPGFSFEPHRRGDTSP